MKSMRVKKLMNLEMFMWFQLRNHHQSHKKTLRNRKKNFCAKFSVTKKLFPCVISWPLLLLCADDLLNSLRMTFAQALTEIGRKADID